MRDHLDKLESKSVHILREAYAAFGNLCMLWSIGKDSTVLLWLARKAFYGHVPFPLVHIDTHYKIPEMIEYRDKLAMEYGLYMVYGENRGALENHEPFPDGKCSRVECCRRLKTEALTHTLDGTWPRYRLNLQTGKYERDTNTDAYTGVIVGARADDDAGVGATSTTTGIWTTSRPSSGTSSKPTLPPARMCASIPCSTGRS